MQKSRGLWQKLDALRLQNGQSLSKYQHFIRKLVCYKEISFFKTYLNSWLFVCSKCTIQSHIIIFQSFTNLFRELNDREIENHYKMNSKNVRTWHGIIRVSDENSYVTQSLQCFLNLFELQPIFAFSMHHSKRRHQFPTRSDIICCFSVIYRFV